MSITQVSASLSPKIVPVAAVAFHRVTVVGEEVEYPDGNELKWIVEESPPTGSSRPSECLSFAPAASRGLYDTGVKLPAAA